MSLVSFSDDHRLVDVEAVYLVALRVHLGYLGLIGLDVGALFVIEVVLVYLDDLDEVGTREVEKPVDVANVLVCIFNSCIINYTDRCPS